MEYGSFMSALGPYGWNVIDVDVYLRMWSARIKSFTNSFLVSAILGDISVIIYGQQFRTVCCGAYGGREIQGFLRTVNEALLISDCSSCELYLIG